jgi:hypothetical protein
LNYEYADMNRALIRSLVLAGCSFAVSAGAGSSDAQPAGPKPTTAPGTTAPSATVPAQPAPPPPPVAAAPLPSPKAVALAFVLSLDKGDATVAKALLPPGGGRGRWVDAAIGLSAALKRLDAAAVARFGEAGRAVSRDQLNLAISAKAVEQAVEKIEGDSATLTLPGSPRPLRLKKVGGLWQLEVGPTEEEAAEQVALCERLAGAADATAGEVAAGRYADPAAAARAFAARVTEARLGA